MSNLQNDPEKFLEYFPGNQIPVAALENKEQVAKYTSKNKPKPRHFHGELKPLEKELRKVNGEGWGVFFTVNELDPSLDPGKKRTKKMVVRCRAVWVEDDHPREKPRDDFPIQPNIILESSPGKFHYYWLTSTTEFEAWNGIMTTMVEEYGCDPNAKDLARFLRVPGFDHVKGKPHPVTFEVIREEPYSWEEIKEHFPPAEAKTDSKGNKKSTGWKSQEDHIKAIITGENFHGSLQSVIANHANHTANKDSLIQIARGLVLEALISDKLTDERRARAERMLSPDSVEIEEMVSWAVESTASEKSTPKKYADPLAMLDSLYGLTEDDVKGIGDDKWVYENVLLDGHILTLIGESGAGKTALLVYLSPEFVKAGYEVRYFNLDSPYAEYKRLQRLATEGGYTVYYPDIKGQGRDLNSMMDLVRQIAEMDIDLKGQVFIFDTLKKFVDMMSKGDQSAFFKLLRKLTAKGASIVLLGHANKKREHGTGNLIYEGCGDIRSDTDELLYLEYMDDGKGNRITSTYVDSDYGAKVRGVFRPITFQIRQDRRVVRQLLYTDVRKSSRDKAKVDKHTDIKKFIIEYVTNNEGCSQSLLLDACREVGHPNKTSRELLKHQLANPDSDQFCLYERKRDEHPYPMEYYTVEYYEERIRCDVDGESGEKEA